MLALLCIYRYSRGMKRETAAKSFQTLGDSHRLAIVEHLLKAPCSVRELADELPISRPAVSRHLRVLKANRLVIDEPRGTRRIYRLCPESLEALRDYLERLWDDARRRFVITAENTRGKSR
jgi:DNA-binding transcriptional ArsR family regulator